MTKSKLQKYFSIGTITSAFVVVGILILMITGTLKWNRTIIDFLIIVGIICFGCISCMGVSRYFDDKSKRIPIYVVLGLTGLTCLLWIIFVFVGQGLIDSIIDESITEGSFAGTLVFLKITIIITIQTSLVNLVTTNLFLLKKRMWAFQIVMYVSNAVVDLWLTLLFLSLGYTVADGFYFKGNYLFGRGFLTIFILAVAYSVISNGILRGVEKRRTKELALHTDEYLSRSEEKQTPQPEPKGDSVEDRIKKLDDLKEKGLITDEEYSAKKSKILEDI